MPAVQDLTVDQKLRLVWELWDDVSADTRISPETAALLEERLSTYSANPDNVRTTDEVTAGILLLKKKLTAGAR